MSPLYNALADLGGSWDGRGLMDRPRSVVTPKRFAQGMTFEDYMRYIGTPENLAREAGWWLGKERMDWSVPLQAWYERLRLTEALRADRARERRFFRCSSA
jgi:hypothetical protein